MNGGKRYRGVFEDPKTGTYFYSAVVGKHPDGRPRRQLKRGFATARDADRARRDVLRALETGTFVGTSRESLAQFLASWLEAMKGTLRPSTWGSYEQVLRTHVIAHLGHVPLQQLSPDQLNALYGKLVAGGLAPTTVRTIHVVLHGALDDATRWGRVVRNVATLANPPRATSKRMTTWSPEQLGQFLEHVRTDRLYPSLLLAATTGMRRGELLGLEWGDIDLEAARVSIHQTRIAVNGKPMASRPKTASGRRQIPIPPEVVAALRSWRAAQARERLAGGPDYQANSLVFTNKDGSAIHPGYFGKWFQARANRSGVPRIRFHDLRHTWATLALQADVHPKVVSEMLGHSSIGITLDLYSHVNPGMAEKATAAVAGLIFRS